MNFWRLTVLEIVVDSDMMDDVNVRWFFFLRGYIRKVKMRVSEREIWCRQKGKTK